MPRILYKLSNDRPDNTSLWCEDSISFTADECSVIEPCRWSGLQCTRTSRHAGPHESTAHELDGGLLFGYWDINKRVVNIKNCDTVMNQSQNR